MLDAAAAPKMAVEVPPRVLGINFWVPGSFSPDAFNVTVNSHAVPFTVPYGSEVAVDAGMPYAPGVYQLKGTFTLPADPSAVFPTAVTYDVQPDPRAGWTLPAPRSHEWWAVSAVNAFRTADGLPPVTWSASLELAAERQASYLKANPGASPDGEELPGMAAYTASTPSLRAVLAGYLASPVTEADLRGSSLGGLSAVAELAHGVDGRFFLLAKSLARFGLAANGGPAAVAAGGNHQPLRPASAIQTDPPAAAADVPTAWEDREVPNPLPGGPVLAGYPITLSLPGWNVAGPFSVALIGPDGNPIAGKVITTLGAGRVAFIPARPLLPGRRYRILAAVGGENPVTATSKSFATSRSFTTAPAGLSLARVGGGPSVRVGRGVLVQLTAIGADGSPVHVHAPVSWSVKGPAALAVGGATVSPSGMAEALIRVWSAGPIVVRAMVGGRIATLSLAGVTHPVTMPATVGGGGRIGATAAIAEAAGAPTHTAVILVNGVGATRDAMALSPWLGALRAPLLVAENPERLGAATRSALIGLGIRRVYLVGAGPALAARVPAGVTVTGSVDPSGPVALSAWVASELRTEGDAYRAAIIAPNEVRWEPAAVPLAAVAARMRVPILFTSPSNLLTSAEDQALTGIRETFVIGAPGAPLPAVPNPTPVWGSNRYSEDVLVDHEFFPLNPSRVVFVNGATSALFAAVAASPLAAAENAPIVFMGSGPILPSPVWGYLSGFNHSPAPTFIGAPGSLAALELSQFAGAVP